MFACIALFGDNRIGMDNRQTDGQGTGPAPTGGPPVPPGLPLALDTFARYGEPYLAHHLHAVRLSRARRPDLTAARERPLVVYLNHSSWWDPLLCLQLAAQALPTRRHFAPTIGVPPGDPLFSRLGFYPLDAHPARDARRLLDSAARLLDEPGSTLWLMPGALADPRRRPVELHPWLGHLVRKLRRGVLLPLAVELAFWDERRPEALLRFGEELAIEDAGMRARDWTTVLATHLQDTQDALTAEALARDPSRFEPVLAPSDETAGAALHRGGRAGLLRGLWRRMRRVLPARRAPAAGDPEASS
jgi:hypothetical protein